MAVQPREEAVEVRMKNGLVGLDYVADIEPTGSRGNYRVALNDEEIVKSAMNAEFDACRVLQSRSLSGRIGFRHRDGMIGLVTTIDGGAKLTVSENSGKPRFKKWRSMPDGIRNDASDVQERET
jgi:hypothetical protein